MAEHRLRREDDQRLPLRPDRLAPEQVEDLRRRRRLAHFHVHLGAQLHEALDARRRVLGALALVAVRQQQDETTGAPPLGFARGDELVDHHLGAVGEVAELRFPDDEVVGGRAGVAVLEGEHGLFREHRVEALEAALPLLQVGERVVDAFERVLARLAVDRRVAVEEGAATDVLTGEAHAVAGDEQGRVGEVLAHPPVEGQLALAHRAPVVDDLLDPVVQDDLGRDGGQALGQATDLAFRNTRIDVVDVVLGQEGLPVDHQRMLVAGNHRVVEQLAAVEVGAVVADHALGAVGRQHALGGQLVGVELARPRVRGDAPVHQGLRHHRLVLLVVAELAEADDVDDDVLLEGLAVLDRDPRHEGDRFRVVAIDVEDRRLGHLEDVGAVDRRAQVTRVRGGEADLVVDDDVHRAAGAVAARLREVEHFLVDALPGHRGVAVDHHRHHLVTADCAAAALARIDGADHHGVHDLEVRGVERERQPARPARGRHVRRVAHVVLDVAGREVLRLLALEFLEQHLRRLAEDVDQHVEAAAVRHADDDFVHAAGAGDAHQFVHGDDRRFTAFEREALLADVTGVQVAFERLGGGQAFEEALLLLGGVGRAGAGRFEALLQPALLGNRADVHVLDADRRTIGFAQCVMNLAEARALGDAAERTGVENRVAVGIGKSVVRRIEFRDLRTRLPLQGVELGPARTEEAIGVDHLQHADLLAVVDQFTLDGGSALATTLGHFREGRDHRRVRDVLTGGTRLLCQAVEVFAPVLGNRGGVIEVALVEFLDEGGISTEQVGITRQLFHHHVHLQS